LEIRVFTVIVDEYLLFFPLLNTVLLFLEFLFCKLGRRKRRRSLAIGRGRSIEVGIIFGIFDLKLQGE
jgi:hypothetical protein